MSRQRRLAIVLLLNLLLIAGLIVVGLRAHSLGVLAAGGDYLADASAIGVSLLAIRLSRRPVSPERPNGHPYATTIAALINAGWLLILEIAVVVTAAGRLTAGVPSVAGLPVLITSAIAAVVMLVGALVLGGDIDDGDDDADAGEEMNVRAVLLDTAADAAAAGGVAASGAVILATGGTYWLDPAVALAIALVIAYHAVVLIRRILATLRR